MSSVGGSGPEAGIVAARKVRVAANGTTSNVGELQIQPGIRISGRVLLSDGKPLPVKTVVSLEMADAKKAKRTVVDSEGNFIFPNLLAGSLSLVVNVPGYRLSAKNKSLDKLNGDRLSGKVTEAVEGLRILLEPGQPLRIGPESIVSFVNSAPREDVRPQDYPLRGAPGF